LNFQAESRRLTVNILAMRIAFISAVMLLLSFSACTKSPDAPEPKTRAEEIAERERKNQKSRQESIDKESAEIEKRIQANEEIRNVVAHRNAVTDWGKELAIPKQLFTSTFQEALVRTDKRTVLLFTQIDDDRKEGDRYLIEFESDAYDQEIHFYLECTADQVKVITNDTSSSHDDYAIVAVISSVRKPRFAVNASPKSEEEAEIDLDASSILLATGSCVDLVNIGSSNP